MLKLEFRIPPLDLNLRIDTEGILDDASAALLQNTLTRFLSEMSPDGKHWVPSRAALKRKMQGIKGGTLYDTGRMFSSIKVTTPDANTRSIGTDVPYAEKHNTGIDGMPKREFLGVGDGDFAAIRGILEARFKDYMK